jgi:hypothetical protein
MGEERGERVRLTEGERKRWERREVKELDGER